MNIVDKILVDPITRGLKFFTKGGVPAYITQVRGRTDGSAAAAGEIGEKISSVSGTLTASASQVWANATSINLSAGVWLVSGTIVGRTVIGFITFAAYISTTNTITGALGLAAVTGCTFGYDQVVGIGNSSSGWGQVVIYGKHIVTTGASTPVYLGFAADVTAANQFIGSMQAIRIA